MKDRAKAGWYRILDNPGQEVHYLGSTMKAAYQYLNVVHISLFQFIA